MSTFCGQRIRRSLIEADRRICVVDPTGVWWGLRMLADGRTPAPMDRANLADRVGMTATGGTFQTYLSRLKSNGLIEVAGRKITLTEILFSDDVDRDPSVTQLTQARNRLRK